MASPIFLVRQQLSRQWWHEKRAKYELVSSQPVVDEARAGAPSAAQKRLHF